MGENSLKYFGNLKVSEIMVSDPLFYTTPEEKISTTELLMLRKKIGGLPVVSSENHKRLIGIITQRDIRLARFAMNLDDPKTSVRDLMTAEPFVVKVDDSIKKVLELMFTNKIGRVPVVNDSNELIGLVSQQDILKILLQYLKE
ncbi:MAG: CBS domain-containing protein [Promethearchaeota archaeon]